MVQHFFPFSGMACGVAFWHGKHTKDELVTQCVHFGEQRQQVIGGNFQKVYFLQFLAKPGAGRA
jgi:hypothetical protein